jgi:hypothetical protein
LSSDAREQERPKQQAGQAEPAERPKRQAVHDAAIAHDTEARVVAPAVALHDRAARKAAARYKVALVEVQAAPVEAVQAHPIQLTVYQSFAQGAEPEEAVRKAALLETAAPEAARELPRREAVAPEYQAAVEAQPEPAARAALPQ